MKFQPSELSYGVITKIKKKKGNDMNIASQITAAIPTIAAITQQITDPHQQVEVLKAQIKNARQMRRKFPFLSVFFTGRIRKLKAKIKAAKRRILIKKEGEESTRVFRNLGWAGAFAGVLVVTALGIYILRKATAVGQPSAYAYTQHR